MWTHHSSGVRTRRNLGVGEASVVGTGPCVGGRGDGGGGVASNVTADAGLALGLGVDVGREVGGEGSAAVTTRQPLDSRTQI